MKLTGQQDFDIMERAAQLANQDVTDDSTADDTVRYYIVNLVC